MNILLVIPPEKDVYGGLPPSVQIHLGIAYIAAICEQEGYTVKIVDIEAEQCSYATFSKIIESSKPDIVGITCTTPTYPTAVKIAEIIKNVSNSITILGGVHPTVVPEQVISSSVIDIVVKGEGERTFIELIECIKTNGDLRKVKGIMFKRNGEIISTSVRELIKNLDELPFPARHLFKTQKYTYPDSLSKNTFPIITSRGCPGRCIFCNTYNIFGRYFRARSAKNVVDEIELLIKKYNAKEIHIWDDNFVTLKNRVFEIRDELKKRNIKIKFAFPNGLRADFLNEEILIALKEMGTYSIAIGVESGSQEILNRAKKGIKLEQVEKVIHKAKNLGIEVWTFFMFGLPGETKETIKQTIKFVKKLDPDIAKFHILKPYPGTEVYNYFIENDLLITTDYRKYGIHQPPVHFLPFLTADEMLNLQKQAYREFYFRPKKILQQIFRMKSINRLMLNINYIFGFIKNLIH